MAETDNRNGPTRRTVLEGGAATGLLLATGLPVEAQQMEPAVAAASTTPGPTMPVSLRIKFSSQRRVGWAAFS